MKIKIVLLCCFLSIFLLTGCFEKKHIPVTTEQFKEYASDYGFKTYEELGLVSKNIDYTKKNIKKSLTLMSDNNDISSMRKKEELNGEFSFATFFEFKNSKSAKEYVNEQKNMKIGLTDNKIYLDVTVKEVTNGKVKRIIISTMFKDSLKDVGTVVYIYSQRDKNVIEITHVGTHLENECKMLDYLGY